MLNEMARVEATTFRTSMAVVSWLRRNNFEPLPDATFATQLDWGLECVGCFFRGVSLGIFDAEGRRERTTDRTPFTAQQSEVRGRSLDRWFRTYEAPWVKDPVAIESQPLVFECALRRLADHPGRIAALVAQSEKIELHAIDALDQMYRSEEECIRDERVTLEGLQEWFDNSPFEPIPGADYETQLDHCLECCAWFHLGSWVGAMKAEVRREKQRKNQDTNRKPRA